MNASLKIPLVHGPRPLMHEGTVLITVMLLLAVVSGIGLAACRESVAMAKFSGSRQMMLEIEQAVRQATVCVRTAAKTLGVDDTRTAVASTLDSEGEDAMCGKAFSSKQRFLMGAIAVTATTSFCGTYAGWVGAEEVYLDQYVTQAWSLDREGHTVSKYAQVWERQRSDVAVDFVPDTVASCGWME